MGNKAEVLKVDTEEKKSGNWTIFYQPGIRPEVKNNFYYAIDLMQKEIISNNDFNRLAYHINLSPTETENFIIWNKALTDFGTNFRISPVNLTFSFTDSSKLTHPILSLNQVGLNLPFCLVDLGCSKLGLNSYENMPIIVGNFKYVENKVKEIYETYTPNITEVKLFNNFF
ncbi:MAG: hypothetical protein M1326_04795 [Cyanobacteria bacterium]|nr:hypothetical protein [Cyanobacteriota bacterium]